MRKIETINQTAKERLPQDGTQELPCEEIAQIEGGTTMLLSRDMGTTSLDGSTQQLSTVRLPTFPVACQMSVVPY